MIKLLLMEEILHQLIEDSSERLQMDVHFV